MPIIKNQLELTSSLKESRRELLFLLEKTLQFIHPKTLINNSIKLKKNLLKIEKLEMDLTIFEKIFIFGIGKASGFMAESLEELLGPKINSGMIIVVEGTSKKYALKKIKVLEGTHPIPSELNIESTNSFLTELSKAGKNDLVIFLISGGGSALLCKPENGIALEDLQSLNKILLKSGLDIIKINTLRKHISKVKGGKLLNYTNEATTLSLIISDVLGDPIEFIASGPTVSDTSTLIDCIGILDELRDYDIPNAIIDHFNKCQNAIKEENSNIKHRNFQKSYHFIIGNLSMACNFLKEEAKKFNIEPYIYSIELKGESREIGIELLEEAIRLRKKSKGRIILISGGETTVTVKNNGYGGRNSELILGALSKATSYKDFVMLSLGTDGSDNSINFEIAGVMIDDQSYHQAREKNLNFVEFLSKNNSHKFFKRLGRSIIVTGDTGTNIADITLVLVE
ncbi:MAG: DUF4147 domain-containing protein [Candidatus Lokiarchaeota archaeon]|nr:DUF4147 domain-containing protein [Candidatus Lokiarchaeota archaeon]